LSSAIGHFPVGVEIVVSGQYAASSRSRGIKWGSKRKMRVRDFLAGTWKLALALDRATFSAVVG